MESWHAHQNWTWSWRQRLQAVWQWWWTESWNLERETDRTYLLSFVGGPHCSSFTAASYHSHYKLEIAYDIQVLLDDSEALHFAGCRLFKRCNKKLPEGKRFREDIALIQITQSLSSWYSETPFSGSAKKIEHGKRKGMGFSFAYLPQGWGALHLLWWLQRELHRRDAPNYGHAHYCSRWSLCVSAWKTWSLIVFHEQFGTIARWHAGILDESTQADCAWDVRNSSTGVWNVVLQL